MCQSQTLQEGGIIREKTVVFSVQDGDNYSSEREKVPKGSLKTAR